VPLYTVHIPKPTVRSTTVIINDIIMCTLELHLVWLRQTRRSAVMSTDTRMKISGSGNHDSIEGHVMPPGADRVTFMQSALVDFDGLRVDAALRAGFDPSRTFLDSAKYRNALHELVLNYTSYTPIDRPPKLHIKFIDILTTLLHAGLDVNDGDYR